MTHPNGVGESVGKSMGYFARGEEYPQCLKTSLLEIKSRSEKLIHQAQISNMWQTRQVLETTVLSLSFPFRQVSPKLTKIVI